MWKYKIRYLVINYRVTMEERATRYEYAKACHMTISHDRQESRDSNFNTPLRMYPLIGET